MKKILLIAIVMTFGAFANAAAPAAVQLSRSAH